MSTGIETADLIDPWIWSTLANDSEIIDLVGSKVYGPLTPDEIIGPYITFAALSVRDVRGIGISRIQVDAIYLVQAISQTTSQAQISPIARRIFTLLDGAHVDLPAGSIDCVRETVISRAQVMSDAGQVRGGGQPFWHLGATFRIRANSN